MSKRQRRAAACIVALVALCLPAISMPAQADISACRAMYDVLKAVRSGAPGRAYVLGADMFGAIYPAFGKERVFSVMQDPRTLFQTYNAALRARPERLRRCPRVPDAAVKRALAIGER